MDRTAEHALVEFGYNSPNYLKMLYYQKTMHSIIEFCKDYNIPLQSPSVRGATLDDAITEKKENIMNFYSKTFAERSTDQKAAARFAKVFYVLSDLIRYGGFDWIAEFRPLDDSKIREGECLTEMAI